MLVVRLATCLLFTFCLCFTGEVLGQQPALWNVGLSTVAEQQAGSGADMKLVFRSLSSDDAAQGASAGATLFEGERDGRSVTGLAWAFSPRCNAESYEVSGLLSADERSLTLKGREPIKDQDCKVTSFQDKTLTLTKPGADAPQPAAPSVAPAAPAASAPGRSYWSHNGSTLYLAAAGNSRELYYDKPRPGMVAAGAQPGALLFRGTYANGRYSGTAFIFSKRCGAQPYQVSGPVAGNFEQITLYGQAPVTDAGCAIARYTPDTLEFALCAKAAGPASTAVSCP